MYKLKDMLKRIGDKLPEPFTIPTHKEYSDKNCDMALSELLSLTKSSLYITLSKNSYNEEQIRNFVIEATKRNLLPHIVLDSSIIKIPDWMNDYYESRRIVRRLYPGYLPSVIIGDDNKILLRDENTIQFIKYSVVATNQKNEFKNIWNRSEELNIG